MKLPGNLLVQRVFSGAWLLACVAAAIVAWDYRAQFSYEPVGPRAYPLLCLALMGAGLAWLILRPTPIERDAHDPPLDAPLLRKVALCIGLFLAYAALFEPLGFLLDSALFGSVLARLYGGRPWPSLLAGALLAAALYLLFDRVLEVPLPLGPLALLSA